MLVTPKKSMKNILSVLCFFILLSCKKDVSELPEASQTGANTFGAKVDGSFWVPQKFGVVPANNLLEVQPLPNNSFLINARNLSSSPTETEFEIFLQNITGPGTILLNQNTGIGNYTSGSYAYYVKRKFMPLNEWITSAQYTGSVTITKYDMVNKILSGSFQFTAGSTDNTANPISVTEGRFDIAIQ
jgi:hypothetical protein